MILSTVSRTFVSGGRETGPIGRKTSPSNLASIVVDIGTSRAETLWGRRGSRLARNDQISSRAIAVDAAHDISRASSSFGITQAMMA